MNILITGGAGFIGSHLVELAIELGYFPIVLDNFSTGKRENLAHIPSNKFHVVEGDITDSHIIYKVFSEYLFYAVFHEAAIVSVPRSILEPEFTYGVNVSGTRLIFEAAVKYNVNHVCFASSAAVYGNIGDSAALETMALSPISPYGEHKKYAEELAFELSKSSKTKFSIFRYFNVFGERQDPNSPYSGVISIFLKRIVENSPITIFGDGQQTRDFIYVKDIARANLMALNQTSDYQIFNAATGQDTSINSMAEVLYKLIGRKTNLNYEPAREGDIRFSVANIEKICSELNFFPKFNLEEGLGRLVSLFVKN